MAKRKKSDDSKLADAADARAKEVNLSPEDAPKVLVDQLQDATVKAKQSGASDDIIRRMEKQLNQLAGIVEKQNATIAQLQSAQLTPARKLTSAMPVYPLCPVCRQVLTACKGMHTYARVLPQLPESIDNFKGVIINGQRYYGFCNVPSVSFHEIMSMVSRYEDGERQLQFNRGKLRGSIRDLHVAEAMRESRQPDSNGDQALSIAGNLN
jgi:hypothetical protein